MKKSILNFGTPLNKQQQKAINGGEIVTATVCDHRHCWQEEVDTVTRLVIKQEDGTYRAY